jgi:putative protein kinase ArgK-like GTPase of G3E family
MSKLAEESQNLVENEEEDEDYETLCGVVVIGAPGTGKTTFTNALQQFVGQLDRKHAIVNLDPANENMEYKVSPIPLQMGFLPNSHSLDF